MTQNEKTKYNYCYTHGQEAILDSGASQHFYPSPSIYILEFQSAWQKIANESNATQKIKKHNRNRNSNRNW